MPSELPKNFNSTSFDTYIISLSTKCIDLINNIQIKALDNKKDGSSLSEADLVVNNIIEKSLKQLSSSIPILSEENNFPGSKYLLDIYWLIDPIDGTKSYISGGKEYTVNIALIVKGVPLIGLIAHPPSKNIWYAKMNSLTILKKNLNNKILKRNKSPVVITSKEVSYELENFLSKINNHKKITMSSSLKFCILAENKADIYPRFSSINKWDIAAGHAIINASGGELLNFKGQTINYQNDTSKTGKFLVISKKSLLKKNFLKKIIM